MKQSGNKQKQTTPSCYYQSYSVCTCNQADCYNSRCENNTECEYFITENDYFTHLMEGKIKPQEEKSSKSNSGVNTYKNLTLGKSKKALKREARIEAEKHPEPSGFMVKDDPRFKDLFSK